jgi:hypothetical protein
MSLICRLRDVNRSGNELHLHERDREQDDIGAIYDQHDKNNKQGIMLFSPHKSFIGLGVKQHITLNFIFSDQFSFLFLVIMHG